MLLVALSTARGAEPLQPSPAEDSKLVDYLERSYRCQTAEDWYQLAEWCKKNGFEDRAERNMRRAIRWDPDHAPAREALGYLLYDGPNPEWRARKWLRDKDADDARKELAALAAKEKAESASRSSDPYLAQCDKVFAQLKKDDFFTKLKIPWDLAARRDVLERNKPYVLIVQNGRDFHYNQIGDVLQAYYAHFSESYAKAFSLPPVEAPLVIIALKDTETFEAYNDKHSSETFDKTIPAYYNLVTHQVICHGDSSAGESNPFRPVIMSGTFTHEATHQILDYYARLNTGRPLVVCRSHWFQEGIAEYIGTLRWLKEARDGGSRQYRFGVYSNHRAAEFHERRLSKKPLFNLEELLHIENRAGLAALSRHKAPDEWQEMTTLFYAEAWSLVTFFRKFEGGARYWDKFVAYVNAELNGRTGYEVFQEIFQVKDLSEMEKQWNEFLDSHL